MVQKTKDLLSILENHLTLIEKQMEELIRTIPTLPNDEQQEHWDRATSLQKEARQTRKEILAELQRLKEADKDGRNVVEPDD